MSEQNHEQKQLDPQGGFVDESLTNIAEASSTPTEKQGQAKKANKGAELKANFKSVFGHGIGKFSLIAIALVIILLIALAVRGFNNKPLADKDKAQVDVPGAPPAEIRVDPIDEREAQRRTAQAAKEAAVASANGETYQPDFNPAVVANGTKQEQPGAVQPQLNVGQSPTTAQTQGQAAPQPVPITVPAGQASANGGSGAQQASAQQQDEQRRLQEEHDKQLAARDKYVEQLRDGVKDQVKELLGGEGKEGGIRGKGSYSTVSYLPKQTTSAGSTGAAATGSGDIAITPSATNTTKKPIFKAGKTIFATLDSEVNTDDGGEVFATVHGGKYDGAKLIGKIEQAPRNIRLRFSILSPQDDRSSLKIDAIAIREQDAKQGVAETIDNHTLERYAALFAGSVLSGIGKAAMQPQGNTIVLPNGQLVVQNSEMTDKRIAMYAIGEVGMNAGTEVRKSFGMPPTYITPANKGIGVIFLSDVQDK